MSYITFEKCFFVCRDDVQRDHSLEPGQGEHAGRGGRGGHHQLRGQPGTTHDQKYILGLVYALDLS